MLALVLAFCVHGPWRSAGPDAVAEPVARPLVLVIHADGRWTLDGQLVPPGELAGELDRRLGEQPVRTLFVRPAGNRPYREVREAVDRARSAGVTVSVLPVQPVSSPSR